MTTLLTLAAKGAAGGVLVVVFAVLGERLRPQSLAGLLAASPSVALASLLVILVTRGDAEVVAAAHGMIIGAVALAIAALVAIDAVRRFRAARGSLIAVGAWVATAASLYGVILR